MSDETRVQDVAPIAYINLLAAHTLIVQMRDYVRMASTVIESLGDIDSEITIRPEALVWGLSNLADDLEEIAEAVRWSKEAYEKGVSDQ
ncbi:hypothetical protein LVB87_11520 [Lysobacter sp. KIS68-7]|uniref:hypothetical protein n=1 Tax=Lysobacter sp. KIS68-7 TaxID=2904252 RepID=UPI001E60A838|nr:hypothetical protein [Lysobacter sp. KIS68-7]UHQ18810.1 hypothetical protein LVB87_11520 [Lysobacter sp. KIS68-7]